VCALANWPSGAVSRFGDIPGLMSLIFDRGSLYRDFP